MNETKEIGIAAFMVCRGLVVTGTRLEGRRVYFIFDGASEETFDTLRAAWFSGGDQVSAYVFNATMKKLKHLVYQVIDARPAEGPPEAA